MNFAENSMNYNGDWDEKEGEFLYSEYKSKSESIKCPSCNDEISIYKYTNEDRGGDLDWEVQLICDTCKKSKRYGYIIPKN